MKRLINLLVGTGFCLSLTACGSGAANLLNPYSDNSTVQLGVANNQPLLSEGSSSKSEETARTALQVMGEYRRAQAPQPAYPVIQPAEVRLMWIPDHLNKFGDLVPQHFYYLKVLDDRWAVQDAFDIERQLNEGDSDRGGSTPWVHRERR